MQGQTPQFVQGAHIGPLAGGQSGNLQSQLASQGGVPVAGAVAMQTRAQQPQLTPSGQNLPNMQTTPSFRLQQPFAQQTLPMRGNPVGTIQGNPFMQYLQQTFGPNANRTTNLQIPSYLRQMLQNGTPRNVTGGTMNPRNVSIPVSSPIGASPTPSSQNPQIDISQISPGLQTQFQAMGGVGSS